MKKAGALFPKSTVWRGFRDGQINQADSWYLLQENGGQVEPPAAGIEHGAVGRDDRVGALAQEPVGAVVQFDRPGPAVLGGEAFDKLPQTSGIGDRPVQQDLRLRGAEPRQGLAEQADRALRLADDPVGPVQARQVADAAVPTDEQVRPAQGRLQRDQQVEAVHPDGPAGQRLRRDLPLTAVLQPVVRAGASHDGQPLADLEGVAVAYQFEGAFLGVAAGLQPGQVLHTAAQEGDLAGGKEPAVLRVRSSMASTVGHPLRITEPRHPRKNRKKPIDRGDFIPYYPCF